MDRSLFIAKGNGWRFFLMWGGGGRLSHCFQGNGGYKSSLTEVKGEAIDRKLTANEEGSQQIKTTS